MSKEAFEMVACDCSPESICPQGRTDRLPRCRVLKKVPSVPQTRKRTEHESFFLELAMGLNFEMVGDDAEFLLCHEDQLIDFAHRIETAGFLKGVDDLRKATGSGEKSNVIKIPVSKIERVWLRRIAISITLPFVLLYCALWIPFALIFNALYSLATIPLCCAWGVIRTAREQW